MVGHTLGTVLRDGGRLVVRNRQLTRVTGTWGLWITGEWAVLVLLSVTAFDRGGTAAVATVGVVRLVPGAALTPLLSVLADRASRVRVLCGVLVSWAVLISLVPVALHVGSLLPMYGVVVVASLTSTLLRPAVNALVPQVIDRPEDLAVANSTYSLVEAAGSLLGPLLSGALVSTLGTTPRYLVVAAVFAVAALLGATIRTDFRPAERAAGSRWHRLLEPLAGFPALFGPRRLRIVFAIFLAQSMTRGLLNVFVVTAAVSLLHSGLSSTGALFSGMGAGGLLGAVLTMAGARWRPGLPFVVGMALWGLPLIAIGAQPHAAVTWAALAVVGIGNALGDVYGLTLVHRLVPDHLLGRAFGAFWGAALGFCALGSAVAPALIDWLGLRWAIIAVGIVMAALPLAAWFAIRNIAVDLAVDEHDLAVLGRCVLLAPLTRVALEQLARHAHHVDVAAGSVVVREGTVGDTFYVIADGQLEASVQGQDVRDLAPADCFGEIAALNHTPRTATVVARTTARLLALDGADFVHAVTGHRPASYAAEGLVRERIARAAAPADRPTT
jgi:MFS family permease